MGIFNQHSDNQPQQGFLRGLQGSPGVGFNLFFFFGNKVFFIV